MTPESTTGVSNDPNSPPPEGWDRVFKMVDYPQAGITRGDIDWVLLNMPELTNVQFKMYGRGCMSVAFTTAAEAVNRGLTHTCIVVRGWHNLAGRYYVGQGAAALDTASGPMQVRQPLGHARGARPLRSRSRSTWTSTVRSTT